GGGSRYRDRGANVSVVSVGGKVSLVDHAGNDTIATVTAQERKSRVGAAAAPPVAPLAVRDLLLLGGELVLRGSNGGHRGVTVERSARIRASSVSAAAASIASTAPTASTASTASATSAASTGSTGSTGSIAAAAAGCGGNGCSSDRDVSVGIATGEDRDVSVGIVTGGYNMQSGSSSSSGNSSVSGWTRLMPSPPAPPSDAATTEDQQGATGGGGGVDTAKLEMA
ncbi:unnamed protein product, partial [Laminaria digitata]